MPSKMPPGVIGYLIFIHFHFARHFAREDPIIPNETQSRGRSNELINQVVTVFTGLPLIGDVHPYDYTLSKAFGHLPICLKCVTYVSGIFCNLCVGKLSRVGQGFTGAKALLKHPRNTLKILRLCPKLCPRESPRNQLQPIAAKMEGKTELLICTFHVLKLILKRRP
jgi:hypothetical protein